MKRKIKNLKRRWRKLTKIQRRLIAFLAVLAFISFPFSPTSSLWVLVIITYEVMDIIQQRKGQYYFYLMGRNRNLRNRIRLLDELMESTNKYVDLLLKYNKLRAAHNKLLRRRRKENNQ